MTLILETGNGVRNANSYVTSAYIDNYLTVRSRETENGWDTATSTQKDAAAIKATQYIDDRFGHRFKGTRLTNFDGVEAVGQLDFAGLPNNDDTLIIGSDTYTFKTTLSTGLTTANEVEIGVDAAATAANLVNALDTNEVEARVDETTNTQINLNATQEGSSGNDVPLDATNATNVTSTGFINGEDGGSQPLAFPRSGLRDGSGRAVLGIPQKLKEAVAEYAIRAHNAELFQDPAVEASARPVVKEKLGPIETEYASGGSLDLLIRPYPAADYMLKPYLMPVGTFR